jgi:hypothetical protein
MEAAREAEVEAKVGAETMVEVAPEDLRVGSDPTIANHVQQSEEPDGHNRSRADGNL